MKIGSGKKMKLKLKSPARSFFPRGDKKIEIKDHGEIELLPDEQITFVKESGKRIDFASKTWGYYVTPSVNNNLKKQGFKTALVKNEQGNIYVLVVEKEKMDIFLKYCDEENQKIIEWLDEK